ncbi:hypothetical protein CQY20_23215 [Mycolicibacterium agri]|uniref:Uncharacterized protein n=1 Tax=Mycolicibacterium agri TaxID=36811 RepID=A0A2A7MT56_MYCAG|nr:hypothetical protein [Mycolicibacterium agri]PEG34992.1 hypothetical protein CQY20_23215 [Mycolicibacterium agri]GFG54068.1 hypothetical protein MAGR_55090 [Mycolicibacterium agri]
MPLLADRNFAVTALAEQLAAAQAHVLIHCIDTRVLPPIKQLPDRSRPARMGSVVIHAAIPFALTAGEPGSGAPLGHHPD